jgi:hypothetical protein
VLMGLHWCREVNPRIDKTHGRYDYYGHDVNVCARIAAQARGGQILATSETMAAIAVTDEYPLMIAPNAISVLVKRNVELKGVSEKVELHAMAPLSQITSGYVASKLLTEGSRGMRSTSRASLMNGGSHCSSLTDTTLQSGCESRGDAQQMKTTVQYSSALLRLAFKAVPDGVKSSWLIALAKTLRVKADGASDSKQEQSLRFEELRTAVRDNCAQSLTATHSTDGGTIDGSMASNTHSVSTHRRQSDVIAEIPSSELE